MSPREFKPGKINIAVSFPKNRSCSIFPSSCRRDVVLLFIWSHSFYLCTQRIRAVATSSPVSLEVLRKSCFVSSARVWCEVNDKGFLIKSSVGYGAKRTNERTRFRFVRTKEFVFLCIARFSSRAPLVVSPWVWSLLLSRRELKPGFEKLISL